MGIFPILSFVWDFCVSFTKIWDWTEGYIWKYHIILGVYCILAVFKKRVFFNYFFPFSLSIRLFCFFVFFHFLLRFFPSLDSNSFAKFTRRDPTHSRFEQFGKLNLNPETKNLQCNSSSTRIRYLQQLLLFCFQIIILPFTRLLIVYGVCAFFSFSFSFGARSNVFRVGLVCFFVSGFFFK